jgi:sec-independent protein translocase protein TatA
MFGLGVPELIFILLLALLIFGPKKLPEIGRTLGKGMSEFRRASNELTRTLNAELALDENPAPPVVRANPQMEALREPRTPQIAAVPSIAPVTVDVAPEPSAPFDTQAAALDPNDPIDPKPIEPA